MLSPVLSVSFKRCQTAAGYPECCCHRLYKHTQRKLSTSAPVPKSLHYFLSVKRSILKSHYNIIKLQTALGQNISLICLCGGDVQSLRVLWARFTLEIPEPSRMITFHAPQLWNKLPEPHKLLANLERDLKQFTSALHFTFFFLNNSIELS